MITPEHMYSIFASQSGLDEKALANVKTALHHLAKALEKPFEDLTWADLQDRALVKLADILRRTKPDSKNIERLIYNNKFSLKRVLEFGYRKGFLKKIYGDMSPAWQQALSVEGLHYRALRYRHLQRARVLARFCTMRDIDPAQVTEETWRAFGQWLQGHDYFKNWKEYYHRASRLYTVQLPGIIPKIDIPNLTNGRLPFYGLRFTQWPAQLRVDWEQYIAWATCQRIEARKMRKQKLRKTTEERYRGSIERLLGYLVTIRGIDITQIRLRELVDHELWITDFMNWFKEERTGGKVTTGLHSNLISFHAVAKTYYRLDKVHGEDWWLADLLQWLHNNAVVDPMKKINPFSLDQLEGLRDYFFDRIASAKRNAKKDPISQAAHQRFVAMNIGRALMYGMLCRRPYRITQYLQLKLGKNLYKNEQGQWLLYFAPEDLKVERTGQGMNYIDQYFPEDLVEELENYLSHYRPCLIEQHPECNLVFPTTTGQPIGIGAIENQLKKISKKLLGRAITPHRFRDSFASDVGVRYGNLVLVKNMLNHSNIATTEKHYMRVNQRELSRKYDEMRLTDQTTKKQDHERKITVLMEEGGLTREDAERLVNRMESDRTDATSKNPDAA